jgi:hypothetical protein
MPNDKGTVTFPESPPSAKRPTSDAAIAPTRMGRLHLVS